MSRNFFNQSIHNFLVNLKRQRRAIFETIGQELIDRYLTEKALGCFSLVKPSESAGTLEEVSRDLFSLVERFLNPRCRFRNIFGPVTENDPYAFSIAA